MRGEAVRKSIHLLGLAYIPLYFYLHIEILVLVLFSGFLFFIFLDILRLRGRISYPDYVLRKYEYRDFGGHVYFITGALLATILFSREIAMLSILFLAIGDAVSGLVKRIVSPLAGLVSGLIASIISGSILLSFMTRLPHVVLISGAITATILDFRPVRMGRRYINDNLTIPVVSGIVMSSILYIMGKF